MSAEACYELPMSITNLRLLSCFRTGSHSFPIEQDRLARPGVPRHLCRCTFCTDVINQERYCVSDCLRFCCLRLGFAHMLGSTGFCSHLLSVKKPRHEIRFVSDRIFESSRQAKYRATGYGDALLACQQELMTNTNTAVWKVTSAQATL